MSSTQKYIEALEGKIPQQQPALGQAQQNYVNGTSHAKADELLLQHDSSAKTNQMPALSMALLSR